MAHRFKFPFLLMIGVFAGFGALGQTQFKVLHFAKTSGFDHGTRANSLAMFQSLGQQHTFMVDDDPTGAAFDSLSNLQQYAVVIFSNTSGDQILTPTQRANFEAYINGGGSFVGIHAASDTYRHSTANGSNTGTWDFYAEMLGASVQANPHHTAANHNGTMDVMLTHPTTANIPNPWNKIEEYYYWENGYYNPLNTELLQVRSTGPNSYDAARPISWYKEMFTGTRIFYTALGHANSNFTNDTNFRNHLRDAVLWAVGQQPVFVNTFEKTPETTLYPNPAKEKIYIAPSRPMGNIHFEIIDISGRKLNEGELTLDTTPVELDVRFLSPGVYFLRFREMGKTMRFVIK